MTLTCQVAGKDQGIVEKREQGKIRRALEAAFLGILLAGMTAAAFALLHRYAEYGREASVNTAEQEPEATERETASGESTEKEEPFCLEKLESGLQIRVQILGDDYLTEYHEALAVTAEDDLIVGCRGKRQVIPAGKVLRISPAREADSASETDESVPEENEKQTDWYEDGSIALAKGQMLSVRTADGKGPLVLSGLKRGQKNPAYEGKFYIYGTEEGLLAVNEVDLETYLQSVVSSEMPSSYPMQALCAQAVCARTYAVNCMDRARKEKKPADLDDSTSFQVYNNYPGDALSAQAAALTEGLVMNRGDVYYYSTSCLTEGRTDLDNEENFRKFLDAPAEENAEYGSPWTRWSAELPKEQILDKLEELYGCAWRKLRRVEILERNEEGQVQKILLSDGREEVLVEGEYQIRRVLGCAQARILLRDGSEAEDMRILPSAYFYIREEEPETFGARQAFEERQTDGVLQETDRIVVCGGGYGHGIGMSQNGAAAMAQNGAGYEEILRYYYA